MNAHGYGPEMSCCRSTGEHLVHVLQLRIEELGAELTEANRRLAEYEASRPGDPDGQ